MDFKKHYQIDAEVFDYFGADQNTQNEIRRNYYVLKYFSAHPSDKVLEIGSGRGWFSCALAKQGFDITALDLSQKNLALIKQQAPSVKTRYGSADDLPFGEEKFDWIVMNEVLEHLHQPKEVLEHLSKFLTKQGKLFISVPYKEKVVQELCIHCHKLTPRNAHLHSFDKEALYELANETGYFVINSFTYLNKIFTKTGLIKYLKFLPNSLFEIKDQFLSTINDKAEYISIILMKKG